MAVTRYKPCAVVSFFTEKGKIVRDTRDAKSKIDNSILSIQTTRDMGADAPTFSIVLPRTEAWHKIIAPNDLIMVSMWRPPEKEEIVFVGLVDDVRKSMHFAGESPIRSISVTGRGVAKSLISFDVGVVPEAEYASTTAGWLVSQGINLAGSPCAEIVQAIWDYSKRFVNYRWGNGIELFGVMDCLLESRPNLSLMDDSNLINWQNSLWALIKEIAEEPFYEAFWEIMDNKPTLMVRPTPFNENDWWGLPEIIINDEDVVSEKTGRSDVETYTIFSVGAKTLFSANDPYKTFGTMPLWYKPYGEKYGIRRLHRDSIYTAFAGESGVSATEIMQELQIDLYNWNILNNSMFNGTIVVKGSNRFKVGCRLVHHNTEEDEIMEYYIRSVSHNFVNFQSWTTTLEVTRGTKPNRRFIGPYGDYQEYSGLGLVEFGEGTHFGGVEAGTPYADRVLPIVGIYLDKAREVVNGAYSVMNTGVNGHKVKYVFGGNSITKNGVADCSSFSQYIYSKYGGMDIGRTTGTQVTKGNPLDKSQLQPGDLVFFKGTYNSTHLYGVSHVGVYVGNDKFIHNSSSSGTVVESSLSEKYWAKHWLMGRRVLQDAERTAPKTNGTTFEATGYGAHPLNLGAPPNWVPTYTTATGTTPVEGRTVAVDPKVIPLHSKLYIESSYPGITGEYIAEDVGGAIKGNKVDIYFNDIPPKYDPKAANKRIKDFGRRNVKVTVLRRGKG